MAMVMVFGAPFVAAWALMLNPEWLPIGRTNHGALIQPPVATPIRGTWALLVTDDGSCGEECRRARTVATVVRRALGPEAHRVKAPADCREGAGDACVALRAAIGTGAALVVVDPDGNAMLRYGPEVTPRDLLHDVQRLLKSSRYRGSDGYQ